MRAAWREVSVMEKRMPLLWSFVSLVLSLCGCSEESNGCELVVYYSPAHVHDAVEVAAFGRCVRHFGCETQLLRLYVCSGRGYMQEVVEIVD